MRYFTPVVFLLAAVSVGVANTVNPAVIWYMPFEAIWPELKGQISTQGHYTVVAFAFLGAMTLARAWFTRERDTIQ